MHVGKDPTLPFDDCEDMAISAEPPRGGKATASQIAMRWSKSEPERRLWFAAMQLQDCARALTAPAELPKLAAGFDRINRAREQLRGPLRTELVILDALSALAA